MRACPVAAGPWPCQSRAVAVTPQRERPPGRRSLRPGGTGPVSTDRNAWRILSLVPAASATAPSPTVRRLTLSPRACAGSSIDQRRRKSSTAPAPARHLARATGSEESLPSSAKRYTRTSDLRRASGALLLATRWRDDRHVHRVGCTGSAGAARKRAEDRDPARRAPNSELVCEMTRLHHVVVRTSCLSQCLAQCRDDGLVASHDERPTTGRPLLSPDFHERAPCRAGVCHHLHQAAGEAELLLLARREHRPVCRASADGRNEGGKLRRQNGQRSRARRQRGGGGGQDDPSSGAKAGLDERCELPRTEAVRLGQHEDSTLRRWQRAAPGQDRADRCRLDARRRFEADCRGTTGRHRSYRVVGFGLDRREVVECFEAPRSRVSAQLEPSRVGPGELREPLSEREDLGGRVQGFLYACRKRSARCRLEDAPSGSRIPWHGEDAASGDERVDVALDVRDTGPAAKRGTARPDEVAAPAGAVAREHTVGTELAARPGLERILLGGREQATDNRRTASRPEIVSRRGHAGNARHSGQAGLGDPEAIGTLPPLLYEELIGGLEVLVRPGRRRGDPARAGTRTTGAFEGSRDLRRAS